ncbi:MAG: MotA/TolQ/ExbB proton channel family protein [Akkermansia sp.]|nr:MotA/TolQ/ExbB proton channel family protein [Akkermansia sp.]
MYDTIRQFFAACHPFGLPLLACSVIMLAAILYHLLFTRRHKSLALLELAASGKETAGSALKSGAGDELVEVLGFLVSQPASPALAQQVEARLRCIIDRQRAGLATISIITTIAPMLGILGTAWGLVDIFGVFGSPDAQEGIALGISKALYTTIFGLAIAVPGTIALSCFERAIERRAARINQCFTDLLANHNAR